MRDLLVRRRGDHVEEGLPGRVLHQHHQVPGPVSDQRLGGPCREDGAASNSLEQRRNGLPVFPVALGAAIGQELEQVEHVDGSVRGALREGGERLRVGGVDAVAGLHARNPMGAGALGGYRLGGGELLGLRDQLEDHFAREQVGERGVKRRGRVEHVAQ